MDIPFEVEFKDGWTAKIFGGPEGIQAATWVGTSNVIVTYSRHLNIAKVWSLSQTREISVIDNWKFLPPLSL